MSDIVNVDPQPGNLPVLSDAEEQVLAIERVANLAARRRDGLAKILVHTTYPSDWTRFGEKGEFAGLSAAGADRVAEALGGFSADKDSWRRERSDGENKHGRWFRWTYTVAVDWKGKVRIGEGTAFSQELFFGFTRAEGYKDPDDVVETNVMNAARHRAFGEAVKLHLGLRRFPVEALEQQGYDLKTVKFADNRNKGADKNGSNKGSNRPNTEEEKQQLRDVQMKIGNLLMEMNDGDRDAASEHLKKLASFGEKIVTSVTHLTTLKWAHKVLKEVESEHETWVTSRPTSRRAGGVAWPG